MVTGRSEMIDISLANLKGFYAIFFNPLARVR